MTPPAPEPPDNPTRRPLPDGAGVLLSGILRPMRPLGQRSAWPRLMAGVAVMTAVAALLIGPPTPVDAADRGLVVVAQARYQVLPDRSPRSCHDRRGGYLATAGPPEGRVFYSRHHLRGAPAGATNVAASSGGRPIGARVQSADANFTVIEVTFERGVFYQAELSVPRLLRPARSRRRRDRDLRISPSIVAFPVWAFGSSGEPGGSVTRHPARRIPAERPGRGACALDGLRAARSSCSTASLPDPVRLLRLSVRRPARGLQRQPKLTVQVGGESAPLNVRAWQDDPEWGTR